MFATDTRRHAEVNLLYSDHHSYLVGWLRRRIACVDHAHDLAQDTFLRILGGQHLGKQLREPRAWLTTIAHGLLVDHIRRQQVEWAYLEALAHWPEAETSSPENQYMILQMLSRIDALLDSLPAPVRTAFLTSRLEAMSYPAIAQQLQVSLSTVEKYMARAIYHCLQHRAAP